MTAGIGIIGGTGIYQLPGLTNMESLQVNTPYGIVPIKLGEVQGKKVAFLTRHGEKHNIAPNQINYRANIWALRSLGVREVFATACSGSLNRQFGVGDLVLLEQFLEFTKNRSASFYYSNGDNPIAHVDVTKPYCQSLRDIVLMAAKKLDLDVQQGATYCCTEGPRYESAAEIKMFQKLGGDLVGHTNYPEVVLAREAEMCYCAIGIVSNMAAGINDEPITSTEVTVAMQNGFSKIQALLLESIKALGDTRDCNCQHSLQNAFL